VIRRGRGINILSKLLFLCLDVLNTVIQDTEENKPVFDPDFHTELIIKHENEDIGNSIIYHLIRKLTVN